MKKTIFTGAATAIVTPFKDGKVDYESYERLLEWQIAEGISAIVTAGTTGEGSTLTDDEHKEIIKFTVDKVAGRVPVIAGTGSNDTAYAIELTKYACEAGADAMLVVTPYYNKATQKGLIASFTAIADASTKPIILYNVPSRTGCNILPETAAVLAEHPNIVAIKEASGNISQIAKLAHLTKGKLDIYSGNDDQIVPVMSLGGKGVISVMSNILPHQTHEICRLCLENDFKSAAELALKYNEIANKLFIDVNPVPVKEAMNMMGMIVGPCRLPLYELSEGDRQALKEAMVRMGLVK